MASYHLSIKSGKKGKASDHAAYIAREGRYGKNDKGHDLIAKEHGNLPDWAKDNPALFWKMADENERINGAAYREYELALPRELTLVQQQALLREFINSEIGDKPYQFAVHSPAAALGGNAQPHAHIMLSDRKPDGINRSPDQHFKRFNPTRPEAGGCKKDSGGKDRGTLKNELVTRREKWAALQNSYLEKHGHTARVDHRSNRERGLSVEVERHLGHVGIKKMSADEKKSYLDKRLGKTVAVE
ncbi:MAG: MobA/MobL family protein [Betaproteobacteria bacterium]